MPNLNACHWPVAISARNPSHMKSRLRIGHLLVRYGCWSELLRMKRPQLGGARAEAASGLVPGAARHDLDVGPQSTDPH